MEKKVLDPETGATWRVVLFRDTEALGHEPLTMVAHNETKKSRYAWREREEFLRMRDTESVSKILPQAVSVVAVELWLASGGEVDQNSPTDPRAN